MSYPPATTIDDVLSVIGLIFLALSLAAIGWVVRGCAVFLTIQLAVRTLIEHTTVSRYLMLKISPCNKSIVNI